MLTNDIKKLNISRKKMVVFYGDLRIVWKLICNRLYRTVTKIAFNKSIYFCYLVHFSNSFTDILDIWLIQANGMWMGGLTNNNPLCNPLRSLFPICWLDFVLMLKITERLSVLLLNDCMEQRPFPVHNGIYMSEK